MDHLEPTESVSFLLIQIWECALNSFIVELIHKRILGICHLFSLGATNPKHVLVDPYVQMFPNRFENLHHTQTQHITNIYHLGLDMCWWV